MGHVVLCCTAAQAATASWQWSSLARLSKSVERREKSCMPATTLPLPCQKHISGQCSNSSVCNLRLTNHSPPHRSLVPSPAPSDWDFVQLIARYLTRSIPATSRPRLYKEPTTRPWPSTLEPRAPRQHPEPSPVAPLRPRHQDKVQALEAPQELRASRSAICLSPGLELARMQREPVHRCLVEVAARNQAACLVAAHRELQRLLDPCLVVGRRALPLHLRRPDLGVYSVGLAMLLRRLRFSPTVPIPAHRVFSTRARTRHQPSSAVRLPLRLRRLQRWVKAAYQPLLLPRPVAFSRTQARPSSVVALPGLSLLRRLQLSPRSRCRQQPPQEHHQ